MADGILVAPSTDPAAVPVLTDEVAILNGVALTPPQQAQRVKMMFGPDGQATDVTDVTPLPVGDAGGSLTVDDGGSSLTVDGVVSVVQAGSWVVTVGDGSGPLTVDGAVTAVVTGTVTANAGTGTMSVSASSLPLPAGAATAAKQPALGTAGSAASDVVTVQGIAGGTALPVTPDSVATANVPAQVGGSTTSVQLLPVNSNRRSAIITNDSTAVLYVKLGTGASPTSYTYKLTAGQILELPTQPRYTGPIHGIWASATGAAAVTEL